MIKREEKKRQELFVVWMCRGVWSLRRGRVFPWNVKEEPKFE